MEPGLRGPQAASSFGRRPSPPGRRGQARPLRGHRAGVPGARVRVRDHAPAGEIAGDGAADTRSGPGRGDPARRPRSGPRSPPPLPCRGRACAGSPAGAGPHRTEEDSPCRGPRPWKGALRARRFGEVPALATAGAVAGACAAVAASPGSSRAGLPGGVAVEDRRKRPRLPDPRRRASGQIPPAPPAPAIRSRSRDQDREAWARPGAVQGARRPWPSRERAACSRSLLAGSAYGRQPCRFRTKPAWSSSHRERAARPSSTRSRHPSARART